MEANQRSKQLFPKLHQGNLLDMDPDSMQYKNLNQKQSLGP